MQNEIQREESNFIDSQNMSCAANGDHVINISCWKEEGGSTNLATEVSQMLHVARFGTNKVHSTVECTFAGKEIHHSLLQSGCV